MPGTVHGTKNARINKTWSLVSRNSLSSREEEAVYIVKRCKIICDELFKCEHGNVQTGMQRRHGREGWERLCVGHVLRAGRKGLTEEREFTRRRAAVIIPKVEMCRGREQQLSWPGLCVGSHGRLTRAEAQVPAR